MRIVPLTYSGSFNKVNNKNTVKTRFESNGSYSQKKLPHQYTGEISYDLAYASMFDSKIANDLKLMGLI